MISPFTNTEEFAEAIQSLANPPAYHFVKRPYIVEKLEYDGRSFYSKYERVDERINSSLVSKHLAGKTTLAIPLVDHGKSTHVVFVYDGDAPEQFLYLFGHLMDTLEIGHYYSFMGNNANTRIVAIKLARQNISELYAYGKELSSQMENKMTKNWKILPDPSLPEQYNILTIPYIN